MEKCVVFIGIKHCGKSTQGKLLAQKLQCEFKDSDELLSAEYMIQYAASREEAAPRAIMLRHGEDFFRRFEADVIRKILNSSVDNACVLALGGGVPDNPFLCSAELKKLGVLVYLDVAPRLAFERIAAGGIPPFLAGEDPRGKFMNLFEKRTPRFREIADITVKVPAEPVAEDLCGVIYKELVDKCLI